MGKVKRILRSVWLTEQARWVHLGYVGPPSKSSSFNHTNNPLLTKLVRQRWLNMGLVHFYLVIDFDFGSANKTQKRNWPVFNQLDLSLGQ